MINSQTSITKQSIKALAKYHVKEQNSKSYKLKKRLLISVFGVFIFVMSLLNAYGLWMKYHESVPTIQILFRSSILLLLSFFMILTGVNGPERGMYLKLKDYFSETKAKTIDYQVSDDGIHLIMNGTDIFYNWDSIEYIKFDHRFFYFTSGGKHGIMDKNSIDEEDTVSFERMIKRNHIPYVEL